MNDYIYRWLKIKLYVVFDHESNKKQSIEYFFLGIVSDCQAKMLVFSTPMKDANQDLLCSVDAHVQHFATFFEWGKLIFLCEVISL